MAIFSSAFATIPPLTRSPIFRLLPLALLTLLEISCAGPLGPGFHVLRETLEVRYVSGSPAHLQVRATFFLKNVGDRPLDSIDVALPGEKDSSPADFRIELDGRVVSPQAPLVAGATSSISFGAPWPQKALHTLVISYHLADSSAPGARFGVTDTSFFLATEDWYPLPRAPKSLFAESKRRPARIDLVVRVPDGFLVHAAGRSNGKSRRSGETEFRFRIAPEDFSPFVVAGRYHEQKFSDSNSTVIFWTFHSLAADQVSRVGQQVAATVNFYDSTFGPRSKPRHPVWVAECPLGHAGDFHRGDLGGILPEVALIESGELQSATRASTASPDELAQRINLFLAYTWFGLMVRPDFAEEPLPLAAAAHHVLFMARASREGDSARREHAARFLKSYDSAAAAGEEKSLTAVRISDAAAQVARARDKSVLFFLALEDECGKDSFARAMKRLTQSLRGRRVNASDLRAALESETGKPLGDFFRLWLSQPGIPTAFRSRYASENSNSKNERH